MGSIKNKFNIGGVFEYCKNSSVNKSLEKNFLNHIGNFSINGRSSLLHILLELKIQNIKKIYIPLFCCESIIITIKYSKIKYSFYSLDKKLNPIVKPEKDSALLVINYFGRESDMVKKYERNKNNNYFLIEDATHNFLSKNFNPTLKKHYVFFSLRKHSHINMGGWSNTKKNLFKINKLHKDIFNESRKLKIQKKKLIDENKYINKEDFFVNSFDRMEEKISKIISNNKAPNALLKEIKNFPWVKSAEIRRKNWKVLDDLLKNKFKKIFDINYRNEVPLGYVILVNDREKLRNYLKDKRIFTSIHWPIATKVNNKKFSFEKNISKQILTIPIDQRYKKTDMIYIASCLLNSGIK